MIRSDSTKALGAYIGTYCEECYKGYESGSYCPVCLKCYENDNDEAMVCCDVCDRWVHAACDPGYKDDMQALDDPDAKFVCALCDEKKLGAMVVKKREKEKDYMFKIVINAGHRIIAPPAI